jgi:hypothetical protein
LRRRTKGQRAVGLLLALHHMGYDPYEFQRYFSTWRFDIDLRWKIRKYLRANTGWDAVQWLSYAFDEFDRLKRFSLEELMDKGWVKQSDLNFIHSIEKHLTKIRYDRPW